jgi:hypothetical protein
MVAVVAQYQVILLGSNGPHRDRLRRLIEERTVELGLAPDTIRFFDESDAQIRDMRLPSMAVFFGSPSHAVDAPLVTSLIEDSIVIAPLVPSMTSVSAQIPPQLRHVNALSIGDAGIERVASLVMETFRLLRRERRLFISYRRDYAQPLAERLYDALDARGFDVFIDVRSVPPAVDFQSELWHRMSDSDVVVLIDTPGFRESRWTIEELAKANATNIQILHLLWPGQEEDSSSAFSHFEKLQRSDFSGGKPGRGRRIKKGAITRICNLVEGLRAQAIAARYRYLIDNFCNAARDLGMNPVVQPDRCILLDFASSKKSLAVVPAVGVPTSDRIHEMFAAAAGGRDVWIVYDNRGVLSAWLNHLDWLDNAPTSPRCADVQRAGSVTGIVDRDRYLPVGQRAPSRPRPSILRDGGCACDTRGDQSSCRSRPSSWRNHIRRTSCNNAAGRSVCPGRTLRSKEGDCLSKRTIPRAASSRTRRFSKRPHGACGARGSRCKPHCNAHRDDKQQKVRRSSGHRRNGGRL